MAVDITLLNANSVNNINNNFQRVKEALVETLGREGDTPNQMNADLDMNNNDLLNVNTLQVQDLTIDGTDPTGILERALEAVIEAESSAQEAAGYVDIVQGIADEAEASKDAAVAAEAGAIIAQEAAEAAAAEAESIIANPLFDPEATNAQVSSPVYLDLRQRARPLTQWGSNLVLDYDETGSITGASNNTLIIQKALDSGEPEIIIPRKIVTDGTLVWKYASILRGNSMSRSGFVPVGMNGVTDAIHLRPVPADDALTLAIDKRGFDARDFGIFKHSTNTIRYGIYVDTTNQDTVVPGGTIFLNKPSFRRLRIDLDLAALTFVHDNSATGAATGVGHYTGGMFGATIAECWFGGGTQFFETGDSNNILYNIISGNSFGIHIKPVSGAARNLIMGNNITTTGGAIFVSGGLQTSILYNQFEQDKPYTGPAPFSASVTTIGDANTIIEGNNINGHDKVHSIFLQSSTESIITRNSLATTGAGKSHILIDSAEHTHVVGDNIFAQTRIVTDNGSITSGVEKNLTAASGWTVSAGGAKYFKDNEGFVTLYGALTGGTVNTTMTTLPFGYRPVIDVEFVCVQNANLARVSVTTAGVVAQVGASANTTQKLNGIRFKAA